MTYTKSDKYKYGQEYAEEIMKKYIREDGQIVIDNEGNHFIKKVTGNTEHHFVGGVRLSLDQVSNEMIIDFRTKNDSDNNDCYESLCIDKTYEAINFLLTGTPDEGELPASSLMMGQKLALCSETILSLNSEEVKAFNTYIQKISPEDLIKNYDSQKMRDLNVYIFSDVSPEDDELIKNYILYHYSNLKDFIKQTAENNYALILAFV